MGQLTLRRNSHGVTLMELLLASALLAGLLLAATSFYVSSYQHFKTESESYLSQADVMIVIEDITRKGSLANTFTIAQAGKQLAIRLDYHFDVNNMLVANSGGTGNTDPSDDLWLKYRFVQDPGNPAQYRLRWRQDTNANAAIVVTAADPELSPGLIFTSASGFTAYAAPMMGFTLNVTTSSGNPMTMSTGTAIQGIAS